MWKISIEGFGPSAGRKIRSAMADDGFLRSLREMLIWEGVWPYLDAVVWNGPEKCGPHGVLLFFLIQKKLAIVPNSEAFNSFIGVSSPRVEGRK